jgi:lysophospholipase L1-like esterase
MQKQMEFSFSILDKIFKLLERNNIPVVVITIPNRAHLSGTNQPSVWTRDSIDHIEAFCHKRGIPFHCPLTEFDDEVKRGTLLYYSDDMHANPTGMKLWSKSLSAYLLKTDIIR